VGGKMTKKRLGKILGGLFIVVLFGVLTAVQIGRIQDEGSWVIYYLGCIPIPAILLTGLAILGGLISIFQAFSQPGSRPGIKQPDSGDKNAERGIRLLSEGKHRSAVDELEKSLQLGLSPQHYEMVYKSLGNAYIDLGNLEKAISYQMKAIEITPDDHQAWVNLGVCYRLRGDFDEAENSYAKALALDPDYAKLHSSMGVLFIQQDKPQEAVKHLEKAVDLDKQLAVAWANLSLAYAMVEKFNKASETLKKAVALGYKNGPVIYERIENLKALAG
jgi:tetratricopeptide (TPR) repeat protein